MDDPAKTEKLRGARQRLERLAWLLDDSIVLPGTQRRFGLDPLIGLIPGVGDIVGACLSLWLVIEAARLGAPGHLLLRMVGNVLVETIVGIVPVVGDLFDFYWKANSRNRDLLAGYIDHQLAPGQGHRTWFWFALALLVVAMVLLFYPRNVQGPHVNEESAVSSP